MWTYELPSFLRIHVLWYISSPIRLSLNYDDVIIPEGGWKPDAGSKNPSLIQSPREKHSSSASPPRKQGLEEGQEEEEEEEKGA